MGKCNVCGKDAGFSYSLCAEHRPSKNVAAQPSKASADAPPLFFKDGASALEYACKYLLCPLKEGSVLPAVVLDSRQLFGTAEAVKVQTNGIQILALRVASPDGGFLVMAQTSGADGPKLQPGQLVAWLAGQFSSELVEAAKPKDKRFGWVGMVVEVLRPELRQDHGWAIAARFNP